MQSAGFQEKSNVPLEYTPNPYLFMKEILNFGGLFGICSRVPLEFSNCYCILTPEKTTQVPRFGAMKCLYALARKPEHGRILLEDVGSE